MSLSDRLRAELGDSGILEGAAVGARHRSDMSGTGAAMPQLLVRPRSTAEVAAVLKVCNAAGASLTVQGNWFGVDASGANRSANAGNI